MAPRAGSTRLSGGGFEVVPPPDPAPALAAEDGIEARPVAIIAAPIGDGNWIVSAGGHSRAVRGTVEVARLISALERGSVHRVSTLAALAGAAEAAGEVRELLEFLVSVRALAIVARRDPAQRGAK